MAGRGISGAVEEALSVYGFVKLPLSVGIVNYSSLARVILPAVEEKLQKKVSAGAVTIAIQRTAKKYAADRGSRDLLDAIANTRIRLAAGHRAVNLPNSAEVRREIARLQDAAQKGGTEKINTVCRSDEVLAILGESHYAALQNSLGRDAMEEIEPQARMAVISLSYTKKAVTTFGYLSYFLNELSFHGINLYSIFSTEHGLSFVIADGHAAKAYDRISYCISMAEKTLDAQARGQPQGK